MLSSYCSRIVHAPVWPLGLCWTAPVCISSEKLEKIKYSTAGRQQGIRRKQPADECVICVNQSIALRSLSLSVPGDDVMRWPLAILQNFRIATATPIEILLWNANEMQRWPPPQRLFDDFQSALSHQWRHYWFANKKYRFTQLTHPFCWAVVTMASFRSDNESRRGNATAAISGICI